jgi:hypothetical protein
MRRTHRRKPRPLLGRIFRWFRVAATLSDKTCRIFCFACRKEKAFPKKSIYRLKSCGCLRNDLISLNKTVHGHKRKNHRTVEYTAYMNLRSRCNNPNNPEYHRYGGRGVKVCKRWAGKHDFPKFLADLNLKPSPDLSIDRIRSTGDYTPRNTRWADARTQRLNQRRMKRNRSLATSERSSKSPKTAVQE